MNTKPFEVTYSLYRLNTGSASIGSSSTMNVKTVVQALHASQARSIVESMFSAGNRVSIHGCRPL